MDRGNHDADSFTPIEYLMFALVVIGGLLWLPIGTVIAIGKRVWREVAGYSKGRR